jgi:hypothetical protein
MKRPIKSDYQYDHRDIIKQGGHISYSEKVTKKWIARHKQLEYMVALEKYIDYLISKHENEQR